jgi:hypothetical protein
MSGRSYSIANGIATVGWRKRGRARRDLYREVEFEYSAVFTHMCNVGRLRNGHNTVLSEQPS